MVRVGGGWQVLEAFLEKNDPCRGNHGNDHRVVVVVAVVMTTCDCLLICGFLNNF